MFQAILQDLRYAWRSLLAHPAFSLIAAGSLALGVSTAAGVFTVLDGAYGKGIPFPNADRLVVLYAGPDPDNGTFDLPGAELEQVVNGSTLLASVAPYRITYPTVHAKDWATRLSMVEVTQAFTSAIGIRVIAGRGFTTRDEQPDAPGVAIISYSLWATRFGASQDALGQSLEIDGRVHEIVGVVNRETAFPDYASLLWTARPLRALLSDTSRHGLYGLALLKPGVTPAQADAELAVVTTRLDRPSPRAGRPSPLHPMPFRRYLARNVRGLILFLTMLGGIIGIIAAVNFATLVLARGMRRREELGIRAALGASPRRLMSHVLAECVVASIAGGVVGGFTAPLAVRLLGAILGAAFPPWIHPTWGLWGALAAIAMAVALGLLFGLSPAIELATPAAAGFLRGGAGAAAGAMRQRAHRRALVAFQVALASGPIVFFGAIAGRELTLRSTGAGLDEENLFAGYVQYDVHDTNTDRSSPRATMLEAVRSTPGVMTAGVSDFRYLRTTDVSIADAAGTTPNLGSHALVVWQQVGPQYFATSRFRLIAGRLPTDDELKRGELVAVVSLRMAKSWAGGPRAGWRAQVATSRTTTSTYAVVGVVDDFSDQSMGQERSVLLTPFSTDHLRGSGLSEEVWIRASPGTKNIVPAVYASLKHIQPATSVLDLIAMRDRTLRASRELRSITTLVFTIFGIALSLSALGIYGMIAYAAVMRRKEVAIRLALGASRFQLASLVLGEAALWSAAGLVFGILGGIVAAVYVTDGRTVLHAPPIGTTLMVVLALAATILLAAVGPVRRVWRVDSAGVLREEG